jgi:hypothetical protein
VNALVCGGAGPPSRNGKDVPDSTPFPKHFLNPSEEYHSQELVQANRIWSGWCRHALWIFSRYWASANPKDLFAFARHVHGMRTGDVRRIARIARFANEFERKQK